MGGENIKIAVQEEFNQISLPDVSKTGLVCLIHNGSAGNGTEITIVNSGALTRSEAERLLKEAGLTPVYWMNGRFWGRETS